MTTDDLVPAPAGPVRMTVELALIPLPAQVTTVAVRDAELAQVLVVLTTAAGSNGYFFSPDEAERIAANLTEQARVARTGIVVANGAALPRNRAERRHGR